MATPVDRSLVGFVDTPVSPTDDPRRLGSVTLSPPGPFRCREHVELKLVYTVGHHGLDDRGAIQIVMRFPSDGGPWQFDRPAERNHVTATARRPCGFRMTYEAFGHARPWFKVLKLQVVEGCLREGDQVVITLGDRSGGGPGLRLQTFCEDAWELRFLVDPCATGHFVEVPDLLSVPIVPDTPHRVRLFGPTRWPVGEPWRLGVVWEDRWGNPSDQADGELELQGDGVEGLRPVRFRPGERAHGVEGLRFTEPGVHEVVALHLGEVVATWRVRVTPSEGGRTFWGDLHGQSGETVGINTAESYFTFARDLAFLDATSHQGNAFQISGPLWDQLNALTARFHAPGRFVTFPGYEWSGNTAVGGDRNVYFRSEGRPIRRSSHALLLDRSDTDTDCTTAAMLFEALAGEDAVAYAHVGGRWADLRQAHDGRTERAVEIHSAWGTFEWLLHDAFALGHRVGVVANSDGHKGRPGASWPGAATFGAIGGLTAFEAPELTRDALFDAIRHRRTVGTSGARLDLDVAVALPEGGMRFDDDPALGPCGARRVEQAGMGDIVGTVADAVQVEVDVTAQGPVHWIEVRRGAQVVQRTYGASLLPEHPLRVRLLWEGALYRGRGRQAVWDGTLSLHGAKLDRAERINAFNPDHAFEHSTHSARWQAITTGNFGGLDLWLADVEADAEIRVQTAQGDLSARVDALGQEPTRSDCGGLGLALSLCRMAAGAAPHLRLATSVPLFPEGDTPVWVCVTLEDGHQAWSSPTYLIRETP